MMTLILTAVLLLGACAGSDERTDAARPDPQASAAPAPGAAPGATKPPSRPSGTMAPPPGVRPAPSPGGPPPSDGSTAAETPDTTGPLPPPAAPGEQAVRLAGCVTAVDEAAARRFAEPPRARGEAQPGVTVKGVRGGVHVVHELTHACCLRAEITSRLEGERVVVTERLVGDPCRCQCTSTLETAVAVPPGRHEVTVVVERPRSEPERVHEAAVTVP